MEGQEYLQRKKRALVKVVDAGNIKWDFGSGDYKVMADAEKA